MNPIDRYVEELRACLKGPWLHRRRTLAEVREHLSDVATELEAGGIGREQAERRAIERFGDVAATAELLSAPRHRRRRVLGSAAVVVAVLVGAVWLSGSGGTDRPPMAFASATPWIPVSQKVFNPYWAGLGSPQAPRCRQGDLRGGSVGAQGAGGELLGYVKVINRSDHTCVLRGGPALTLLDKNGRTIPVPQRDGEPASLNSNPRWPGFPAVPLLPHHTAGAFFTMRNVCERRWITAVRLHWLGGTVAVPADGANGTFRGYCVASGKSGGLYVGHFQPEAAPNWASDVALTPLVASISSPYRVHAGRRLDYLVTLTNPTGTPYHFDGCPTYWQGLSTQTRAIPTLKRALVLNCTPTPTIVPHGHRVYRMQLTIPQRTPAGEVRLFWLADPLVPSHQVAVRIKIVR